MMAGMNRTSAYRELHCPVCRDVALRPAEAGAQLASLRCERCGGQWVRGEQYYQWLDHGAGQAATADDAGATTPGAVGEAADNPRAKLCPECGTIMRRYRFPNTW